MKDKYYTPELKEFHVGFEYEIHNDPRTNEGWDKEVVESSDWNRLYCIKEDNDADYRVKYIDKDDIESIEFKGSRFKFIVKKGYEHNESDVYVSGNFLIELNELTHQLSFIEKIILPSPDEHKAVFKEHFDLIVKNKSELKELLTKINIS